jgi:tripartite-type tricarboxylate transporter receptor subunit TctC
MVARAVSFLNNQPVVVVNKAGAGTVAASKYVLDGRSDGYTLYNISTSSMMVAPLVHKTNFSWRDFIGLGQVISEGDALFVRTDTPYTNMDRFIEYARQNPGKIKYATSGAGEAPTFPWKDWPRSREFQSNTFPPRGTPKR